MKLSDSVLVTPYMSLLIAIANVVLVSSVSSFREPSGKPRLRRPNVSQRAAYVDVNRSNSTVAVSQYPTGRPVVVPPQPNVRPTVNTGPTIAPPGHEPVRQGTAHGISIVPPASSAGTGVTTGWNHQHAYGKIVKLASGAALLLPALGPMIRHDMTGRPPHPFILAEDAVTWPPWIHDLVQMMALFGIDLILLAAVEYDWSTAMFWLQVFLVIRMLQGFAAFTYCVTSSDVGIDMAKTISEHAEPVHSLSLMRKRTSHLAVPDLSVLHSAKEEAEPAPLVAANRFQDLGNPWPTVIVLLMAQIIFFLMFRNHMMLEVQLTHRAYYYWAASIPAQMMAKNLMGKSFDTEILFWNQLLQLDAGTKVHRELNGNRITMKVRHGLIFIRALMSFYVNNVSMSWIVMLLPLFMMSSASEIDFVKDCFAVIFITTLDDVSEEITIVIEPMHEEASTP